MSDTPEAAKQLWYQTLQYQELSYLNFSTNHVYEIPSWMPACTIVKRLFYLWTELTQINVYFSIVFSISLCSKPTDNASTFILQQIVIWNYFERTYHLQYDLLSIAYHNHYKHMKIIVQLAFISIVPLQKSVLRNTVIARAPNVGNYTSLNRK